MVNEFLEYSLRNYGERMTQGSRNVRQCGAAAPSAAFMLPTVGRAATVVPLEILLEARSGSVASAPPTVWLYFLQKSRSALACDRLRPLH